MAGTLVARRPTVRRKVNVGAALQKMGHIDQAIDILRQGLALRPDFHIGHCNLVTRGNLRDLMSSPLDHPARFRRIDEHRCRARRPRCQRQSPSQRLPQETPAPGGLRVRALGWTFIHTR